MKSSRLQQLTYNDRNFNISWFRVSAWRGEVIMGPFLPGTHDRLRSISTNVLMTVCFYLSSGTGLGVKVRKV